MPIGLLPLLASAALAAAALVAFSAPRRAVGAINLLAEAASLLALLTALFATGALIVNGVQTFSGLDGLVSSRIDRVSAPVILLVCFIGWIVVRYSRTYLAGEERQSRFVGWLCTTLAAVLLLVCAGSLWQLCLTWIATSLALHRLLLFYPERRAARRAARKKFLVARGGDIALLLACGLMFAAYGTFDIGRILAQARLGLGGELAVAAAGFLSLAAVLKSAQFPTHGWLTEVMETPTPVSALLHAGVINGGGFLLIRLADVVLLSPLAMAALAAIGGFTALFAGLVMLTQPAVKNALAWSTIAQMGFMILECGLGLFPLALLHLLAHSLYKAHAFLSAGGAVEQVAALKRPGPVAIPSAGAVARAFLVALGLYLVMALAFSGGHKSPQALALGAVLIFGVAYLLAQGFADAAPLSLTQRTALYAILTSAGYFALQTVAVWITSSVLPRPPAPGPLEWRLICMTVTSFGAVALVQALFPLWAQHPAAAGLRVHLSNGFYANAIADRLIKGWSLRLSV